MKGWRTDRKIVVIESDDWGSIRMPSRAVYEKCLKAGYPVHLNKYEKYDSLLSEDDLSLLFDVLSKYKDKNKRNPVITANCVVANPDFERIAKDDYQNYYFELITDTFNRYPKHKNNFEIWRQGIEKGVFFPQFHAREHLNVSKFMKALQRGDEDVKFAFRNQMPGLFSKGNTLKGNDYVEATHYESEKDKIDKLAIYLEGLDLFEQLFGYKSLSIIPTNYKWSPDFNHSIFQKEVKYIQGRFKMCEPVPGSKMKFFKHFLGKKNEYGQITLMRNVYFEPTVLNKQDIVGDCLRQIEIAFKLMKPSIVSCHRINFSGFIFAENRDLNLVLFNQLLKSITKRWPEVEFLTSTELGEVINDNLNT